MFFIVSVPEYRHVNLGATVGKVVTGSHTTAGFKEDKRNKATPGIVHSTCRNTALAGIYFGGKSKTPR